MTIVPAQCVSVSDLFIFLGTGLHHCLLIVSIVTLAIVTNNSSSVLTIKRSIITPGLSGHCQDRLNIV